MLAETVAAIDGTIILRLERDFGFLAAIGTSHGEHLATFDAVAAAFTFATAIATTYRLILETFFRVEFLFARCESKFFSAVLAYEGFVFKSHQKNLLTKKKILTFDAEHCPESIRRKLYHGLRKKQDALIRRAVDEKFFFNRKLD